MAGQASPRRPEKRLIPVPRAHAKLLTAEEHAAQFGRTRRDHRTEIAEDYVELIADLIEGMGEARAVDLAGRLGVTNATVNNTVARLQRDGLVRSEPYRSIFLTEKGWQLARHCRRRHAIVLAFLKLIGVSDEVAAIDAEGIEHHVSAETLEAFERFTQANAGTRETEGA
jgi:DtxR family manganese transport transcriptional regulator